MVGYTRKKSQQAFMKNIFLAICAILLILGCSKQQTYKYDPELVFESVWQTINERYCYLNSKNINWDKVYTDFRPQITPSISQEELFVVLAKMLDILKDGHVNLFTPFDTYGYNFRKGSKVNFNESLIRSIYLGNHYKSANGMMYNILRDENPELDKIGYIYYRNFMQTVKDETLDYILLKFFSDTKGLIIDVRSNGGGNTMNTKKMLRRFISENTLIGYNRYKTGNGRYDFSDYKSVSIDPITNPKRRYLKPLVVLSNRGCYSATNGFISAVQTLPQAEIVGDTTGGGGGYPFGMVLPNGWTLRYSAVPSYDYNYRDEELGIPPTVFCEMTEGETTKDALIEKGREIIAEKFRQNSTTQNNP